MGQVLKGKAIVPGEACGPAVVSRQAISFWGGFDPANGEVIDHRHDCLGKVLTGKVFVFPTGKGSSTGSAVLAESIRNGTAPAALILHKVDPILALGAILADELYHRTVPIVLLSQEDFETIRDGDTLFIREDGSILVNPPE